MNDEINKNNMIPGSCDEFTKAEDIAALSKYLKKVKSDLEARTTLEKDNLEVFGRKDPRYNKPLNNLPDGIEVLNQNRSGEVSELVSEKAWIDNDKRLDDLERLKEKLNPNQGKIELGREKKELIRTEDGIIKLADKKEGLAKDTNDILLEQTKAILGRQEEKSKNLENKVDRLRANSEIDFLGTHLESGKVKKNEVSLEEGKEKLKTLSHDELGLGNKKESIRNSREVKELESNSIGLNAKTDSRLEDQVEFLNPGHTETELGDKKETIKANKSTDLSKRKESLSGTKKDVSLGTNKDKLTNTREENILSDVKENLNTDNKRTELSNTKLNISDLRENKLSRNSVKRGGKDKDVELSRGSEKLSVESSEIGLENKKETISGRNSNDIELGKVVSTLTNDKKAAELENSYVGLNASQEINLDEYLDRIEENSIKELSTKKETITDEHEVTLSKHKDNINNDKVVSLESKKEKLNNQSQELGLEKKKIDSINDSRNITLSENIESITDRRKDPTLEEHLESLNSGDTLENLPTDAIPIGRDPEELEEFRKLGNDYNIPLDSKGKKDITELPRGTESLKSSSEIEKLNLENEKLEIRKEEKPDAHENLSEHREILNNVRSVTSLQETLSDTLIVDNLSELSDKIETINDDRKNILNTSREDIKDDREVLLEKEIREILTDNRENILSDFKEKIKTKEDSDILELSSSKEPLEVITKHEIKLGEDKETLIDQREILLSDKKEELSGITSVGLENSREDLTVDEEISLENNLDKLNDLRDLELSNTKDNLEIGNSDLELEKAKENLVDSRESLNLSEKKENLTDTRELVSLDEHKETLSDTLIVDNLSEFQETLVDDRDNHLSETTISIGGHIEDVDLETDRENIRDDRENTLSESREFLSGTWEKEVDELETHKESITVGGNLDLSDTVIKPEQETSNVETLEEYRDDISDIPETPELENFRDDINPSTDNALVDYKDTIEDLRDPSLSDYTDTLEDANTEKDLETFQDKIEDTRESSLVDFKDNISDDRETALEDFQDIITDDRENKLSEIRDDLSDSRENKLEDFKDSIEDNRENNLEEFKDNITDDRENSLEDYKDDLGITPKNELEDFRDDLGVNPDPTLEDFQDKLEDTRENELEDYTDTITDDREPTLYGDETKLREEGEDGWNEDLEDFKDTIEDSRELSLEDYVDEIVDSREPELYDESTKISEPGSNGWEETLEDYIDSITDERENALSDIILENPDTTNWDGDLEDFQDTITDDRENKLSDVRDDIEDDRDTALETTIITGPLETAPLNDAAYVGHDVDLRQGTTDNYKADKTSPDINPEGWNEDLEDYLDAISDEREPSLETTKLNNPNTTDWDEELEDNKETITDDRDPELYDESTKISEKDHNEANGEPGRLDVYINEDVTPTKILADDTTKTDELGNAHVMWSSEDGLYEDNIQRDEDANEEGWDEKLDTTKTKAEKDKNKTGWGGELEDYLDDSITSKPVSLGTVKKNVESDKHDTSFDPSKDKLVEALKDVMDARESGDLNLYYTNILKFAQNKNLSSGWTSKIMSLISSYLSGNDINPDKVEEFEKQLYETIIMNPEFKEYLANKDKLIELDEIDSHQKQERMASYKLPEFNWAGNGLNPSSYLRWMAEKTVGQIHGSGFVGRLRALLMDETLALLILGRDTLEKVTKANRDRLPGGDMGMISDLVSGGAGNAVSGGIDRLSNALLGNGAEDLSLPQNRPEKGEETEAFTNLNDKGYPVKEGSKTGLGKKLLQAAIGGSAQKNYDFATHYITANVGKLYEDSPVKGTVFKGMNTTLSELCGVSQGDVKSVESLYAALRNSPYYTSAGKVTSNDYNPLMVRTLDSNTHWEIIFEPYCGKENGFLNYLPPISEINTWNIVYHGVNTAYSKWIPINSFELGKSKLTTKTLALFDGEISYPISMEYTNELKLTIVDDQFKSWRTYFERCMDASIYNSLPHSASDYDQDVMSWDDVDLSKYMVEETGGGPLQKLGNAVGKAMNKINSVNKALSKKSSGPGTFTTIDKKYQCVAPYKNITFRCTIYSMTPQLSTISKYDLLVLLKDFTEERSGEIDGGASDLSVSFSIVGENPSNERKEVKGNATVEPKKNKDTKRSGTASIVANGVKSVIGVL